MASEPEGRRLELVEGDWRAALDSAPGVFAVAAGGRVVLVNRALARYAGAEPEALVGTRLAALFEPSAAPHVEASIAAVLADRTPRSPLFARMASGAAELVVALGYARLAGEPAVVLVGRDVFELRRAAEQAREKDLLYQRLAEYTTDVVGEYDEAQRLVFVSASVAKMLGHSPDALVGRGATEVIATIVHPDDARRALAALAAAEPGAEVAMTLRAFHADGTPRWLDVRAFKRKMERGGDHVLVSARDATERERALAALRESERRFQSLASISPVVVFRAALDGRCTYVNDRWRDLTGREPKEALGYGYLRAFDATDRESARRAYERARALREGALLHVRFAHRTAGTHWGRLECNPEFGADGALLGWVGSITDVSELKRAEQALAEEQERTRVALDAAQAVRWEYDVATRALRWSPDAERVLGLPPGLLPKDRASAALLWSASDRDVLRAGIAQLAATGEFAVEMPVPNDLPAPVWVAARGRLEHGKDGAPVRAFGIVQNITARKRAEAERASLEEKLRDAQRLESIGLLAGGVAHDFNNLLAGILGNAELALGAVNGDSPAVRRLEDLRDAALRAADLTRQILAIAGRRPVAREPVDLAALAEETARLISPALPPLARLRVEALGRVVVDGDTAQLQQVALNLITNARDALPPEGGSVHVRASAQDGRAILEVRDSGRGMSAATRARAFDPFFTTHEMGRGLGLAVVHGIVRAHGGEIDVESELGVGTRMRVSLPLSSRAVAQPPSGPPSRAPAAPQAGALVLVVDDEPAVASVAARLLENAGLRALVAHDSAGALEALGRVREEAALALLDLSLRGESGADLLPRLRALAPRLPVLLMSGYAGEDALAALAPGAVSGFLAKPFRAAELIAQVRDALARTGGAGAPRD